MKIKLLKKAFLVIASLLLMVTDTQPFRKSSKQQRVKKVSSKITRTNELIAQAAHAKTNLESNPTPAKEEQFAATLKEVSKAMEDALEALKIERTYFKDLKGYTQKEKDLAAKALITYLYPKEKELNERILALEIQNDNDLADEIKTAKEELKQIKKDIENQKIIAGKEYSVLARRLFYTLVAAAAVGSIFAIDHYFNDSGLKRWLDPWTRPYYEEGGLRKHVYNTLFGEPYKIPPKEDLMFWDINQQEWRPVIADEELAKRSFVATAMDRGTPAYAHTPYGYDEVNKTMTPTRGHHYFFDENIGAFRATTHSESEKGITRKHIAEWLQERKE